MPSALILFPEYWAASSAICTVPKSIFSAVNSVEVFARKPELGPLPDATHRVSVLWDSHRQGRQSLGRAASEEGPYLLPTVFIIVKYSCNSCKLPKDKECLKNNRYR